MVGFFRCVVRNGGASMVVSIGRRPEALRSISGSITLENIADDRI